MWSAPLMTLCYLFLRVSGRWSGWWCSDVSSSYQLFLLPLIHWISAWKLDFSLWRARPRPLKFTITMFFVDLSVSPMLWECLKDKSLLMDNVAGVHFGSLPLFWREQQWCQSHCTRGSSATPHKYIPLDLSFLLKACGPRALFHLEHTDQELLEL